jgi:hypothetical protein
MPALSHVRGPRLGMAAPGAGNPPFGIMVAPSGDVRVAVNETGNAANLEASTASENLPLPPAS